MHGLKRVKNRREDGVSAIPWDRLEALLAEYYAGQGYHVEHVGTGRTAKRFDGGIDLKLRKEDQYVLVQCKGWNAYQVPHNEVHQLIGLVVNEGATGAILVTAGEFTRAAIDAAAKGGHVQLVDGDALREMLEPLLEPEDLLRRAYGLPGADGAGAGLGQMRPAPDRRGQGKARLGRGRTGAAAGVGGAGLGRRLALALLSIAIFLLAPFLAMNVLRSGLGSLVPGSSGLEAVTDGVVPPEVSPSKNRASPAADTAPRPQTEEEIRESQRKAEEAMKVIEATTPEV
ncbi:restriction endonuclease [Pseudoxanthomonas kaohsiungensis]|uniref:Restriction endonuclease n=1 Tax=Pseudoxanthomonas kaohsiungensis TaxID=283923 RepID=A0ABW3LX12_9GAMM|nr:restriction endonuclease [Pseudoxanthomonas kaohsiungensis]KAF1705007.1 hypothetical protein CSC66_00240 [Pseudoxanthomonas kaohsiungensis]